MQTPSAGPSGPASFFAPAREQTGKNRARSVGFKPQRHPPTELSRGVSPDSVDNPGLPGTGPDLENGCFLPIPARLHPIPESLLIPCQFYDCPHGQIIHSQPERRVRSHHCTAPFFFCRSTQRSPPSRNKPRKAGFVALRPVSGQAIHRVIQKGTPGFCG